MSATTIKRTTGRKCLLCVHPRREFWNEALATGRLSMSEIARQVGVHKSAVSRHHRFHLQPALAAVGGGAALAWNVKEKSREMSDRLENMLNLITRQSANGGSISKKELLSNWQAVRAMAAEMREWARLHGLCTGELSRTDLSDQNAVIIVYPPSPPSDVAIDVTPIPIALTRR